MRPSYRQQYGHGQPSEARAASLKFAAVHQLNIAEQSQRWWAMQDDSGLIKSIRINERIAQPTFRLRELLGVA